MVAFFSNLMKYAFSAKRAESNITYFSYFFANFETALMFSIDTGCPPEVLFVSVMIIKGTVSPFS